MFTGIIEHLGIISRLDLAPSGGKLTIHAPTLSGKLAVSASIAVNGCCLTIVHHDADHFSADLSPETLSKTSFNQLKPGARVNLEQPLTAGRVSGFVLTNPESNKEFGGHFVLGHVDTIGRVAHLNPALFAQNSSTASPEAQNWLFGVHVPADLAPYIVSKGSLTIDGISLTVARWQPAHQAGIAEIAVIPYTYSHTNLADRRPGDPVNLEADILGKYIQRYLAQRDSNASSAPLTVSDLVSQGF